MRIKSNSAAGIVGAMLFGLGLLAVLLPLCPCPALADKTQNRVDRKVAYWSPDHRYRAVVVYYKPILYGIGESRVDIQSAQGRTIASHDYSDGGTQGRRVKKAAWTADSRFFVFSTESAGGHSPWHSPTHVYDRLRGRYYGIERFTGAAKHPNFALKPPSRLVVEVWHQGKVVFDLRKIERGQWKSADAEEKQTL